MTSQQQKNLSSLADFLKKKGLTQEAIAARLGVSQSHINQLLNGKTPFGKRTAAKWGAEFGLSPAWLLTGEGAMLSGGTIQNNENGDNFNGEQIVLKSQDTHDLLALLKKKDEQIDRLLSIIEKLHSN